MNPPNGFRLTATVAEATTENAICLLTHVKIFGSPIRRGVEPRPAPDQLETERIRACDGDVTGQTWKGCQ